MNVMNYANKHMANFLTRPFLLYTSGRLLLKFINYLSFLISKTQLIIHISIRCATVNTIYYTVHLKTIYTCNFSPFVSVGDYSKTLKTLLIRDKLNFGPSFNTFGVSFTRTLLKRKIMEPNK